MYVITFNFTDGFVGTLTHDDINQIRYWLSIFNKPEVQKDCEIASITVAKNRVPMPLAEAV